MSYETWVNLFSRSTLDQDLRAALAKVGLPDGPEIKRGDTIALEDFEGLSVGFKVASLVQGERGPGRRRGHPALGHHVVG